MMTDRLSGKTRRRAFTLIELLVVVGIIAVLVGILLPVLSSARRTAQAAKCASALREIGNAFKFYAIDNNQYYPPMRVEYRAANPYKVMFGGQEYQPVNGAQTYWMYFLGKYVSKAKFGAGVGSTPEELSRAMGSVLWGCPNYVPISVSDAARSVGGIAVVYTGYGYNGFPGYTANYPPPNVADAYAALGDSISPTLDTSAKSYIFEKNGNWSNYDQSVGKWYKMGNYTMAAERALVGDSRAFVLEAMRVSGPSNFCGQANLTALSNVNQASTFWTSFSQNPDTGQSSYDYYRHGKYPPAMTANQFSPNGGKIAYNVLFADGHVENLQSREQGFKAARMRYPG
jgi:prepilin-type N-terminal cleavage/methylation domain-containing protein/prepilin-type processing-associated H-X9-DG protein